jgi:uncharacterized membrane protein
MVKGRLEALSDGVIAIITPWLACALYVLVAVLWFIPDRRIEKTLNS